MCEPSTPHSLFAVKLVFSHLAFGAVNDLLFFDFEKSNRHSKCSRGTFRITECVCPVEDNASQLDYL